MPARRMTAEILEAITDGIFSFKLRIFQQIQSKQLTCSGASQKNDLSHSLSTDPRKMSWTADAACVSAVTTSRKGVFSLIRHSKWTAEAGWRSDRFSPLLHDTWSLNNFQLIIQAATEGPVISGIYQDNFPREGKKFYGRATILYFVFSRCSV